MERLLEAKVRSDALADELSDFFWMVESLPNIPKNDERCMRLTSAM
jgi:hypothetical protein